MFVGHSSLVAPTLIHGASLAICWVLGALAARAYERDALQPAIKDTNDPKNNSRVDYTQVLVRVLQAGCFSTGLLILATQLDLLGEFHRWVQPGETEEIDFRLLTALVEVLNDIVFEAVTLVSWRLFLAKQNAQIRSE